jgi:hypothetical protein
MPEIATVRVMLNGFPRRVVLDPAAGRLARERPGSEAYEIAEYRAVAAQARLLHGPGTLFWATDLRPDRGDGYVYRNQDGTVRLKGVVVVVHRHTASRAPSGGGVAVLTSSEALHHDAVEFVAPFDDLADPDKAAAHLRPVVARWAEAKFGKGTLTPTPDKPRNHFIWSTFRSVP